MFFQKNSNIIFRNYDSFGYITDNRNFTYKKMPVDKKTQGDKILSASGAIFFSALDNKPKSIEEIAIIIKKLFINVDIETIKNDAKEFYFTLEKDKFVVSGKTSQECLKKDFDFLNDNYNNLYSQKSSLQNSNQRSGFTSLDQSTSKLRWTVSLVMPPI